ncbi:phosphoheptose isomerase [Candidatus Aerophobetes bacterium]|uniref:Phosphoheptose isomerase n=1 Tax=Aerophobetes bacterium TaxID=2030807 RepID=A0A497E3P2_UNCAE|nr:SIS domain-containing protein [Candidatus Aerophobetes bacterium]RLE09182.1 MAG: phosphoheptose isomerase [Candidatus Aerophobetes bacterium]
METQNFKDAKKLLEKLEHPKVRKLLEEFVADFPHLRESVSQIIKVFEQLASSFKRGDVLFICGNGGSFSDAMHIKGELAKSFEKRRPLRDKELIKKLSTLPYGEELIENLELGFPVVVLGESHSLRSAYENDRNPIYAYAQELNSFLCRIKGGIFWGISTSGNAKNVVAAMSLAKAYGIPSISFTGPDGGRLARMADLPLKVPGKDTANIQENQIIVYHLLCRMLEAYFFNDT